MGRLGLLSDIRALLKNGECSGEYYKHGNSVDVFCNSIGWNNPNFFGVRPLDRLQHSFQEITERASEEGLVAQCEVFMRIWYDKYQNADYQWTIHVNASLHSHIILRDATGSIVHEQYNHLHSYDFIHHGE